MKISLTSLPLLLSAAAVHALPADPPVATPPPTLSDDVKESLENAGSAAGQAVAGIISGIPNLIGQLKDAKAKKQAWHDEQEHKAACEKEEELRAALEARRKIAVDRLLHAERVQRDAEADASNLELERSTALQQVHDLNQEIALFAERQKAAEAERQGTNEAVDSTRLELIQAERDFDAAVDEADKLREAIAQIDETIATIGLDDEDKNEVNPDKYPPPHKELEEPKPHKN